MAILRAVAVLKHVSGLAKDNATNSFHFTGTADDATAIAICEQVRQFYTGLGPGGEAAVAAYMSGQITTVDVNVYVVPGTLEPSGRETPVGPPLRTELGTAGLLTNIPKQTAVNAPQEVAVCVSYQGTPGPGVVQRRRRGRIYVGPLNTGAIVQTANVAPRPVASFRTQLGYRAQILAQQIDAAAEWVVYSRPYAGRAEIVREGRAPLPAIAARPATTVNIDQIWVDDEFDTQRSRGLQRTGRTLLATGEA